MAMIFLGSTVCASCGKALVSGDEIIGLPAFAAKDNPLYPYSDAGFHKSCYEKWGKKDEVEEAIKKHRKEFL